MADAPPKTTSEDDAQGGVLAGLPATRPNRMGRRAKPKAAAKPAATRKPKAKAKTKAKPKAKAKPRAIPQDPAMTEAEPTPIAKTRKPRPVRAGHPGLADSAKERPADRPSEDGGVAGAAGELARLGVSVLKGIGKRIPRP